ncbi:cytochrome c [Neorhizobium sp. JUb45]|uniref:c-type cytochrome n=1 Tax=Neorhizobium sp. JUb45 TaxID=2485113 RepID=UPI001048A263|nr:cytochrome c [Neorhizobium sp. JUb45]TCQ99413.1 mono/diheme cytochrome c family protein [Neorhizobium sp. JUb45]
MMRHLATLVTLVVGVISTAAMAQDADLVKRGEYLATAGDCAACHTAPKGGKPFAGGYPLGSPMGTIWSTNITPSKQSGIGNWTEEQFARAVREGVSPSGNLYPAMPYDSYSLITDEDMKALYAYFQSSVAPVDAVPAHKTELSFPFSQRILMSGWNLLNLNKTRFTAKSGEDAQVARGRYLSEGLAHCATCHTPRDLTMAMKTDENLAGGLVGAWEAPNITTDRVSGLGDWTDAEIAQYLKQGHVPGKGVAAGPMAEAVELSLSKLTDGDISAITAYLRTVPAVADPTQKAAPATFGTPVEDHYSFDSTAARKGLHAANEGRAADASVYADATRSDFTSINDGAVLYDSACASCHMPSGAGSKDGYYPSLYQSTATGSVHPNNLVMTVLEGVHRTGSSGPTLMPAFENDMNDRQVAAVASFVAQNFGNPAMTITPETVAEFRSGGPKPLLAKFGTYLIGVPVAAIIAFALLAIGVVRLQRREVHGS